MTQDPAPGDAAPPATAPQTPGDAVSPTHDGPSGGAAAEPAPGGPSGAGVAATVTGGAGRGSGGRELLVTAVVCAVGAGLVLLAAGRGWASATIAMPNPLPARHLTLTGADVAPAVNGLGIAGLAGLAGIIATRGIGRIVVGVLIVAIGAGTAVSAFTAGRGGRLLADLRERASIADGAAAHAHPTLWWTVAVAGGVVLVVAGVYTIVRGRRWPGMSSRYDAPGGSAERRAAAMSTAAGTPAVLWDSLDSGTDPTVEPPPAGSPRPGGSAPGH